MKKTLLFCLILAMHNFSFAQDRGVIRGKIIDLQTSEELAGATILIKGTTISALTNEVGTFLLQVPNTGKIILLVSHVGYEQMIVPVDTNERNTGFIQLRLKPEERTGTDVVVSATRRREKITNAPAAIHVIGTKELSQFAGSNVGELVAKIQGVEYTRSGVDEITFNARGLNSAFNTKVFQLVDGRNTIAAASAGVALFNNGSTNKDDIERIEIVLGPQSALYGPNAHNALFNYITKDPRKYQGTSISISNGSQSQFSARFRHALKINRKWAYKLSGEQATGKDYPWYDSVYAGSANGSPFGSPVAIPLRLKDLTFRRYRGEAHVYYSPTSKADIIVSGGGSNFTRLQVTTGGRNHLRDVTYGFLQGRFVHPRFFANVYNTWGNLGRTQFLGGYTRDFWNRTHSVLLTGPNRYLPPDSAERLADSINTVKEKSQRLNAEMQYNYEFKKAGLSVVTGLTFQQDKPNGYGITLVDSFEKIRVTQYGAVLQLDKSFIHGQLRFVGTTRFDHHQNFGGFLAPRFALVKKIGDGNVRLTWGKAYAMPAIQNQYAAVNRSLYGNATGIYYIPNGSSIHNTETFATTTPLKPEQVKTWEIGYKGNVLKKLYLDINYYNGTSENFISPSRTVGGRIVTVNGTKVHQFNPGTTSNDTLRGASFSTFFNYGQVRAYGLDAGLTYTFSRYINVTIRYSWFGSDITKNNSRNDANKDGYVSAEERSLNTPRHRGVAMLNFRNLCNEKLVINLSARYVEQYDFYSGSQIGTAAGKGRRGRVEVPGGQPLLKNFDWGPVGGFTTLEIEAGYRFNEMVALNTGVTNLLNTRQVEMVSSPSIGRLIMVEMKVQIPYKTKK